MAKPEDLESAIQPPDAPPTPEPKQTQQSIIFDFKATNNNQDTDDDTYYRWVSPTELSKGDEADDDRILAVIEYSAPPPAPDYTLSSINVKAYRGTRPDKDPPSVSTRMPIPITKPNKFQIILDTVNFQENPSIQFDLELTWDLSDQAKQAAQDAYKQKVAEFQERDRRDAHAQYVQLVRERIKLASQITLRDVDVLRGEERSIVSGRIIRTLMQIAPDLTAPTVHVTAELIQQIFDVDKLLYFVSRSALPKRRRQWHIAGGGLGAFAGRMLFVFP